MSQTVKKNQKSMTVTVCGEDVSFTVGREDYNWYINNITQSNKVAPSHNFLMRVVDPHSHETLKKILADNAGAEVQLAGAILEGYTPDLELVVKTSSGALTA
jgi:hypothetical protein